MFEGGQASIFSNISSWKSIQFRCLSHFSHWEFEFIVDCTTQKRLLFLKSYNIVNNSLLLALTKDTLYTILGYTLDGISYSESFLFISLFVLCCIFLTIPPPIDWVQRLKKSLYFYFPSIFTLSAFWLSKEIENKSILLCILLMSINLLWAALCRYIL